MTTIHIHAGLTLRYRGPESLGANVPPYDDMKDTALAAAVRDLGLGHLRINNDLQTPWHWIDSPQPQYDFALLCEATGCVPIIGANYGTSSPEEAAALAAFLWGRDSNTAPIGKGPCWDEIQGWTDRDYLTVSHWAQLRAQTGHPEPFPAGYLEWGNEPYGSYSLDERPKRCDAPTYAADAARLGRLLVQLGLPIPVGVSLTPGLDSWDPGWGQAVLAGCAAAGWTPGFGFDHHYNSVAPVSDEALLASTGDTNRGVDEWGQRMVNYQHLFRLHFRTQPELLVTEWNSVPQHPGDQMISLPHGLWQADSLARLLTTTNVAAACVWWLRGYSSNQPDPAGASPGNWRAGWTDFGLLALDGVWPPCGKGTRYPNYWAHWLVSRLLAGGVAVVKAGTDDANVSVYAARQGPGLLRVLVINKGQAPADVTWNFVAYSPASATCSIYDAVQEEAQRTSPDGSSGVRVEQGAPATLPPRSMMLVEMTG